MVERTPNHDLRKYEPGETDWTHSPDMQTIEERLVVRDEEANRDRYTPHEAATFIATDTGAVYDGDGDSWTSATRGVDRVNADQVHSSNGFIHGCALDDRAAGRIMDPAPPSWPKAMPNHVATYPMRETPVVMIHSEGSHIEEYEELYPRMRERGLPWMMGATPARLEKDVRQLIDTDQLKEMLLHGCEVSLYTGSGNIDDGGRLIGPNSNSDGVETMDDLLRIVREQKRDLEAKGFPVAHLQPRQGQGLNIGEFDEAQFYAVRSLFAASGHGWATHELKHSATASIAKHGQSSAIIERSDQATAAEAKEMIDRLIKRPKGRLRLFFHSHKVEDWPRLDEIFDYIVEQRDAGNLHVASSTGGMLIPWTLPEGDIVQESSPKFESFEDSFWHPFGNEATVENFGDDPYWSIGALHGEKPSGGLRARDVQLNPQFTTMMVQFDARAPLGSAAVSVRADSFENFPRAERSFSVDHNWNTVYCPVGVPRGDTGRVDIKTKWELDIWTSADEVHVKNVKIYPC
ncbi:polysaccharide deacetylase family protein [Halosimplex sp. J119]